MKNILVAKTIEIDNNRKSEIFRDASEISTKKYKCKIAIDPSGQARFLIEDKIYRLNEEVALFYKNDDIPDIISDIKEVSLQINEQK